MLTNTLNSYKAHHEDQADSKNNGEVSPWDSQSVETAVANYVLDNNVASHGDSQGGISRSNSLETVVDQADTSETTGSEASLLQNERGQGNYGSTQPQETATDRTVKRDSSCLWMLHLHLTRSLGVKDSCNGGITISSGLGCIALSLLCFAQYGFCGIEAASVPGLCSSTGFETAEYISGSVCCVSGLFCTHDGVKEAYQGNVCGIKDAVKSRFSAPAAPAPML